MMRLFVTFVIIALLPTVALGQERTKSSACSINFKAPDEIADLLQAKGSDFSGYDAVCKRLQQEDLQVIIKTQNGVLQNRAYGWTIVSLRRMKNGVTGHNWYSSTYLSTTADTPEAQQLSLDAFKASMEGIAVDLGPAVQSVTDEETRLKRVFGPGAN